MTWLLGLYIVIFGAALGALLARSRLAGHVMLGVAGAAGLAYGAYQHGLLGSILPFLILIVAAVQAFSGLVANRAAKFDADDNQMLSGPLAGLGRAQARRLIDQGIWMEGRAGDVLIHEGEPAAQLYYLASGGADVHVKGKLVGKANPGQLLGEATVLGEASAIATVTLTQPSRFWCAQGRALNDYLVANPDARHVLEHGFNVSLREKLEAMNRAAS
jgi:hypothetical protein